MERILSKQDEDVFAQLHQANLDQLRPQKRKRTTKIAVVSQKPPRVDALKIDSVPMVSEIEARRQELGMEERVPENKTSAEEMAECIRFVLRRHGGTVASSVMVEECKCRFDQGDEPLFRAVLRQVARMDSVIGLGIEGEVQTNLWRLKE